MIITAKSLYHSNFVVIFNGNKFLMPENSRVVGIYQGDQAAGARFVDNVFANRKTLDLPKLNLQIAVEQARLRVEDNSQKDPADSILINEFSRIYNSLFDQPSIVGFGFNFDIYYRFPDVIQIKSLFSNFIEEKVLESAELLDLGVQFTLEKDGGRKKEQYMIKVTAPLEIAMHVNHHFVSKELPLAFPAAMGKTEPEKTAKSPLQNLFEQCFVETDEIITKLKF
ncbi:MAG: hypothetical protein V1928_01090 [Parcubacteria group bacterium]